MTHPNAQTNGASLEDCHTNFFSLTELCGIKWRKLVWGEGEDEGVSAPLDDPVISSYTRCLAGDILCVWRRVAAVPTSSSTDIFDQLAPPPPSAPPPLSLRAAKELWIFWYGEEPDLNGLVAPELMSSAGVYGSWETGLSYECRSLLFKALHNLIERCLLSRDFIRLGKWFVQPYNGDEEEVGKSCWHLSFSFAFFVHGDNMVCASVDVRQHPPVRTLTQRRLAKLNKEDAPNTKVILAPFGLDGVLTGETFAASETATTRLLDAWRHFYPVEASSGAEGADGAGAVEVIAGGVRMRYPARYVMLTDMDPPVEKDPDPAAGGHPLSQHLPAKMAETMAERTYRNMMSQTPTSPNTPVAPVIVKMEPMDICGADASTESKVEWDFVDPIKKTACSCSKCPSGGMGGMGGCGGTPGGACSPGSCASPATHSDGAAPAPSPSPHHSTAHQSQGQGQQQQPATPRSGNPQPPPLLHTPAPTPDPHAPSTPTPAPRTPHTPRTPRNQAMESPSQITVNGVGAGCGLVGGCELLKRPVLHAAEREPDPLDDEHTLHMLYDYSTMHAWLDHPVKRFKMESGAGTGAGGMGCGGLWEDRLTRIAGEDRAPHSQAATPDLYAGHNHIRMAPVLPNSVYLMRDVKQEPNDDANKEMKNLFTSDGLLPSYKDLDQIFDNSDDPGSGDETVRLLQVHTPPDSNKSGGCLGDDSLLLCGGGGGGRTGHVRPEELTKMFPTPPSLEHHPQPSPGAFTLPDTDLPVHTHHTTAPRAGSPQDEPIEDWSYVFKPPTICKYVGSSKYAPLTNLPSQVLPLVTLPAHCVYRPKFKPTANTTAPTTNGGEVILKQEMKEPRSVPPPSPASMKAGAGLRTPTHANQPHTPSHMLPLHQPLSNLHSVGVISAPSSVGPAPSPLVVGPGPMSRPAPPPYMGAGGASPPPPRRPDACPLLLNVLLADTVLNIFRDHNFDSCTLCVCNEGPKEVGNIRGADCGVYLAPASVSSTASPGYGSPGSQPNSPLMQTGYEDNDHIKCSCGFSAVINRRLAHRAGLFYEDEMEITGLAEDPSEYKKHKNTEATMNSILELVREQCTGVRSSSNALVRAAREAAEDVSHDEMRVNMLEYTDGGDAAALALEAATAGDTPARCSLPTVHRWPFISARCPRSTQDVMRVLRRIRLLLVDAIQKKCTPVMWNAVDGPLTWRNFLHLAGRGTNDLCEPQPVPPILVGHDRDWLALSPSAIHYWDKLTLEPYSYARDAAYLVVAPDSEPLVENVRTFFRELSTAYEMCRLGRHTPLHRIAREGILRAPRTTGGSAERAEDEWAGTLPTGAVGEVLRSYAATLRSVLAPALAALQLDRALLEAEARADRRQHDSMPPPPDNAPPTTPNSQTEMETDNVTYASCQSTVGGGGGSVGNSLEGEEDEAGAPMLVVYLVEPSGLAGDPERRVGCLALLRCAAALENMLPEQLRPNVNVKIISMEAVTELSRWRSRIRRGDEMRALAMSVFTQSRRLLQHQPNIKSLTGFGTAASADVFLKNKDEKNRAAYRLYSPAYVLAPTKQARDLANTLQQTAPEPSPVLYVSYCLSADQDWLLAVATDSRGELLETAAINIHVPARARRRKATAARRLGLSKLMEFILGVMSQSAHPWRLVVGRIGRIGHGELRSWSGLLSRSNLLKASRTLRELCGSCSLSYSPGAPWILSACLVSTEPDSSLRIMADCYTPCERFSQVAARASHLHTPRDVSCTHILVFPTSAKAESSQSVFQEPTNETDFYPDLLSEITDDDVTGILDIDSLFEWPKRTEGASDEEGGGGSGAGSPGRAHRARSRGHSPAERQANGTSREVFQLQQQPLALGYLVSTAPLGAMPAWWWAACPHLAHLAGRCPTFLKNSLHLHCALTSNEDELGAPPTQAPSSNTHQLDSGITTDVLRYVLEGYNALSWLSLDSNTHDRLSCLPLHMQVLVQLYHTATALL